MWSTGSIPNTCPSGAVLDASAQTLFLTEMTRGMSLTLKFFFEKKVTVRHTESRLLAPCPNKIFTPARRSTIRSRRAR